MLSRNFAWPFLESLVPAHGHALLLALSCYFSTSYPPVDLWPQPLFHPVSQFTHTTVYSLFDVKPFYPCVAPLSPNLSHFESWLLFQPALAHTGLHPVTVGPAVSYLAPLSFQHTHAAQTLGQANHLLCPLLYFGDCDDSRKSHTLCKWRLL